MEEFLKLIGLEDNPFILGITAISLLIIALAKVTDSLQKISEFVKKVFSTYGNKQPTINFKRRGFLLSSVSLGLAATAGYFLIGPLKPKPAHNLSPTDPTSLVSSAHTKEHLILNRKTGIIHHSKLCAGHLPNVGNQILDFGETKNVSPHNYKNLNMYEVIAKQHMAENNIDEAITYFKKAIELTPERIHLYDRLAKLYGKQKKYELIQPLYKNGISKVIATKKSHNRSRHRLEKITRDLNERLSRLNRSSLA